MVLLQQSIHFSLFLFRSVDLSDTLNKHLRFMSINFMFSHPISILLFHISVLSIFLSYQFYYSTTTTTRTLLQSPLLYLLLFVIFSMSFFVSFICLFFYNKTCDTMKKKTKKTNRRLCRFLSTNNTHWLDATCITYLTVYLPSVEFVLIR